VVASLADEVGSLYKPRHPLRTFDPITQAGTLIFGVKWFSVDFMA